MKIVCCDLRTNMWITIGKTYDVINASNITTGIGIVTSDDTFGPRYMIVNDIGERVSYDKRCFKELYLIREEKLESIGIV